MLSSKQCELARLLTKTTTPDAQIRKEYQSIEAINIQLAVKDIEELLRIHDMPFDQGFALMVDDFSSVAAKFNISPATLFCIYMSYKNN